MILTNHTIQRSPLPMDPTVARIIFASDEEIDRVLDAIKREQALAEMRRALPASDAEAMCETSD